MTFTDGKTEDIKGGGFVQLYVGGEYRVANAVSLQATIGYHVDDTSAASNGSVRFTRVPVDLLAYYHVNDKVRLGSGVQLVNGPEPKGCGVASNINLERVRLCEGSKETTGLPGLFHGRFTRFAAA